MILNWLRPIKNKMSVKTPLFQRRTEKNNIDKGLMIEYAMQNAYTRNKCANNMINQRENKHWP